jgi:hypothetical protein
LSRFLPQNTSFFHQTYYNSTASFSSGKLQQNFIPQDYTGFYPNLLFLPLLAYVLREIFTKSNDFLQLGKGCKENAKVSVSYL